MTYYRIARKNHQSSLWQWKSTPLTSLQTVFRFLRLYSHIPQDQLRVFSSSSREGLKELFEEEKQGGLQTSVTAEHFLHERRVSIGKARGGASEWHESKGGEKPQKKAITATLPAFVSQGSIQEAPPEKGVHTLEARRRLEIERGADGDHNGVTVFFRAKQTLSDQAACRARLVQVPRVAKGPVVSQRYTSLTSSPAQAGFIKRLSRVNGFVLLLHTLLASVSPRILTLLANSPLEHQFGSGFIENHAQITPCKEVGQQCQ